MTRTAIFDKTRKYRYLLGREWDRPLPGMGGGKGRLAFLMLNPSKADEAIEDNTVTRCIGYAKDWGYDVLEVVNLYAFMATDPKDLWAEPEPIGPDNDRYILETMDRADMRIAAWGAQPKASERAEALVKRIGTDRLYVLSWTALGDPGHPLMLKKRLLPLPWSTRPVL